MSEEQFDHAFVRGFQKRAEELGLDKTAFMPLLLGSIGPMVSGGVLDYYLKRGIAGHAAKGATALKAGKKLPFGAKAAKKVHDTLEGKDLKATLGNIGTFMGSSMAVEPVFQKLQEKHMQAHPEQYQ